MRRIRPDGVIERFAGDPLEWGENPMEENTGDGGPALQAKLYGAHDVAVGSDGQVYINTGETIRRVGRDGIISTVAGGYDENGWPILMSVDAGPSYSMAYNSTGQATRMTADSASGTPEVSLRYDLDYRLTENELPSG